MKSINLWISSLASLLVLLVGTMIPSAILVISADLSPKILTLPTTWQASSLLLCALTCGPRAGVISSIAYITIGLFFMPVFHEGGGIDYLANPGFGYITGLIPAAWISGRLARQEGLKDFMGLTASAILGLITLHIFGLVNLVIGSLIYSWPNNFYELIYSYSIYPLPAQLLLCPAIGILTIILRNLLLIE